MAITFVGSHVETHAATSAQTVNFSSLLNTAGGTPTVLTDDIVLVAVENASTVNRGDATLIPSGYTSMHTADYQNGTHDSNFKVSYKVMGATPDTSVAIPASNATTAGVAYAIYVFRGVNTITPADVTTVVTGAINTGKVNAAAITPVTAGAWIFVAGGAAVAAGAVFAQAATPDLSTTTNHFRTATITSTTNDANIGAGIKTDWTSGAFDAAAWNGSTATTTDSWSAVTVALRPLGPTAGTATGQGTAVATGKSIFKAAGVSSGAGTATATSIATKAGTGASASSSTVAATGTATVNSAGVSVGSSTVAATGTATVNSAGVSVGSSTVAGTGSFTAIQIGLAAGAATVLGVSHAKIAKPGLAQGHGIAIGVSTALKKAAGVAAGSSSLSSSSSVFSRSMGISIGAGTVSAYGLRISSMTGNLTGAGTATGHLILVPLEVPDEREYSVDPQNRGYRVNRLIREYRVGKLDRTYRVN